MVDEGPRHFSRLKGYLLKKLANQADHVITCSQAIVDDLVNFWNIPEHKISVTHYGISSIWHQPIDEITPRRY